MKKLLGIWAVIASFLLIIPAAALAKDDGQIKRVVLPAGETVDEDYFAAGETVEISGEVNGDVYAFGGQVLVDGVVNGDLISAGGMVTISGEITQDVRVAGGQVSITGNVGRNLTAVGGNVTVSDSAEVTGGLVGAGGNFVLAAPIGKSVKIGVGNLVVSSDIGGKLEAGVGEMRLTSNASVGSDLVYWSEEEASISESAVIGGEVKKQDVPRIPDFDDKEIQKASAGFNVFSKLMSFVTTFVFGLILLKLYPNFNKRVVGQINKKAMVSLGVGFAALVLTPILGVLIVITVFGIPLAFMLLLIYVLYLFVARFYVMLWLGGKLLGFTGKKEFGQGWGFVVGIFVYYILTFIPYIGGLIKLVVVLMGVGALVMEQRNTYKLSREKGVV